MSLRGHVTAAIRAAGCGLPPSLLAAVTYRRPAPPTHRPHYDRYARVTGSCGGAAPTPGKLRAARELLYSPAADRVPLQRGGFRLPHPGKARRGGAGTGRAGVVRSPEGLLPRGTAGALRKHRLARPCSGLYTGLYTEPIFRPQRRVLLDGNRLAPRAGLGATCCTVSGPKQMNPRTGHQK